MTDYALTGKKGTGKSKNAVRLFRDRYLKRKRRCATNLDIDLKAMFGVHSRQTYVRVPDKPSAFDLLAAGHGNPESYDEDLNGGLFLDEMGTWLNTRTFADKERAATLDFFAHARKHGWDTYYIMQNVLQVDKQLRESFIEQTVRHTRFDKVRIPFIGWLLALLFGDKAGYLPRFHLAVARMGTNPQEMAADRPRTPARTLRAVTTRGRCSSRTTPTARTLFSRRGTSRAGSLPPRRSVSGLRHGRPSPSRRNAPNRPRRPSIRGGHASSACAVSCHPPSGLA
jgi:hypothetical protein